MLTRQQLKSLEKDLLLLQRTRSELTIKLRKILEQVSEDSIFCTTLKLLITDLRKMIEAPVVRRAPKKKKK